MNMNEHLLVKENELYIRVVENKRCFHNKIDLREISLGLQTLRNNIIMDTSLGVTLAAKSRVNREHVTQFAQ